VIVSYSDNSCARDGHELARPWQLCGARGDGSAECGWNRDKYGLSGFRHCVSNLQIALGRTADLEAREETVLQILQRPLPRGSRKSGPWRRQGVMRSHLPNWRRK